MKAIGDEMLRQPPTVLMFQKAGNPNTKLYEAKVTEDRRRRSLELKPSTSRSKRRAMIVYPCVAGEE